MNFLKLLGDTIKISANDAGITKTDANSVLAGGLNIAYFAAGAVAVLVIIIAGFYFTTSVYDPQKIAQAKNAIVYSVVGLVVVMLAFVITNFVIGRF